MIFQPKFKITNSILIIIKTIKTNNNNNNNKNKKVKIILIVLPQVYKKVII